VRAFITGATGFVGGAVAGAFRRAGHEVRGLVRDRAKARGLETMGIEPVMGTLEDSKGLAAAARGCDVIVHAALAAEANAFERDRAAVETLMGAARAGGGGTAVIYTSGCWVYGDTAGRVADETTKVNPPAYASLRPSTERVVFEADGARGIVMRPGCVYGGSGSLTAPWFEGAGRGSVDVVGDGSARWAMVHRDDLGDAYVRAAEHAPAGEIFNVSDGFEDTQAAMAQAAARTAGGTGEIRRVPVPEAVAAMGAWAACLVYDQRLSASKAARLLGWAPRHTGFIAEVADCFAAWKSSAD
jgi:nucleoside-diphosphate-sugar epimerase